MKCEFCGRSLTEQEALVHRKDGAKKIICPECFEKEAGVDYKTFAYRREVAKQTFFAVIFCLAATVYAFVEKGPLYGGLGLLLTVLIFFFAGNRR